MPKIISALNQSNVDNTKIWNNIRAILVKRIADAKGIFALSKNIGNILAETAIADSLVKLDKNIVGKEF